MLVEPAQRRSSLFPTNKYFRATQGRSPDVTPDGQRFVFIKDAPGADRELPASSARGHIVVVLGSLDELKARLAAVE